MSARPRLLFVADPAAASDALVSVCKGGPVDTRLAPTAEAYQGAVAETDRAWDAVVFIPGGAVDEVEAALHVPEGVPLVVVDGDQALFLTDSAVESIPLDRLASFCARPPAAPAEPEPAAPAAVEHEPAVFEAEEFEAAPPTYADEYGGDGYLSFDYSMEGYASEAFSAGAVDDVEVLWEGPAAHTGYSVGEGSVAEAAAVPLPTGDLALPAYERSPDSMIEIQFDDALAAEVAARSAPLLPPSVVETYPYEAATIVRSSPVPTAPAPEEAPAPATAAAETDADPRPPILVVEDNGDTRMLLERILRSTYRVTAVADARSALLAMNDQRFAGLVLDINLGGKETGADVLRIARSLPGYEGVFAIALTAYALPGDRERLLASGFSEYISKPFTRQSLMDSLAGGVAA